MLIKNRTASNFLQFFIIVILLLKIPENVAHAGSPVWTFTPLTATTLSVTSDSTATVQYQVTNQSRKSHVLAMRSITGIRQITSGVGVCTIPFTLGSGQSCTLSLEIDGRLLPGNTRGGPIVCQTTSGNQPNPNACYQPAVSDQLNITRADTPNTTTIASSVSMLALSVDCPAPSSSCVYSNAALTGRPRLITISNIRLGAAISVTPSAVGLPAGTTITPASCNINGGGFCDFTVTPGATASSMSATVNFSGSNTNSIAVMIDVLTYGNEYQSGYVFAIDDTTPNTTSVGGKVAALNDQSSAIAWDPGCPGACTNPIAADDNFDGAINTASIYGALSVSHLPTTYAAGLCYNVLIGGYDDWYLPALCEMGYGGNSASPCGEVSDPAVQNMQSNLVDNGIIPLIDPYWSSTQSAADPLLLANFNLFGSGGFQGGEIKEYPYYTRCVRQLTS